jgi:hypothetical protein
MKSRLAGHALQLLGYTLTFLGLGVVAAALFLAGNHPSVPLWVFLAAGAAIGAPLMIAGGRIDSRGRGRVLNQTPEEAAAHYRQTTVLLALHLGMGFLLTAFVIAPLLLRATGWVHPSDDLTRIWIIGWLLALCATRDWTTRPLWRAIERRVLNCWFPDGGEQSGLFSGRRQLHGRAAPTVRKDESERRDVLESPQRS